MICTLWADREISPRNLLQLHHVHGGQQCGDHHHDPQLPPQESTHSQEHARLGKVRVSPAVFHSGPFKIRVIFLQWVPWVLRMSRPGEKFTIKTIQMQNKMKEIDPPSKSLLANVLDMDDDFKTSPTLPPAHFSPQLSNHISLNNQLYHKNGAAGHGLFR